MRSRSLLLKLLPLCLVGASVFVLHILEREGALAPAPISLPDGEMLSAARDTRQTNQGGPYQGAFAPRRRLVAREAAADPEALDRLSAQSALLVDLDTGEHLYRKNSDERRAAASLTKLVTMYVVLDALADGEISREERVEPHPASWWTEMPAGSSLMFLGPDQQVDWDSLLRGLSIASGNDAATAIAYELSGGIEAFARRMTQTVADLGIARQYFVEPSGIDPGNRITAEGFGEFLVHYMSRFPQAMERYHAPRYFTFPTEDAYRREGSGEVPHSSYGAPPAMEITQANRNQLLDTYEGADGLKTGFIRSSGYNLAATADREGRRLLTIVLGVEGSNHVEGGRRRAMEAAALLDYGFDTFQRAEFRSERQSEVRVYGGGVDSVQLTLEPVPVLLPSSVAGGIRGEWRTVEALRAPVERGDTVGYVQFFSGDTPIGWQPVRAAGSVDTRADPLSALTRIFAALRGVPTSSEWAMVR